MMKQIEIDFGNYDADTFCQYAANEGLTSARMLIATIPSTGAMVCGIVSVCARNAFACVLTRLFCKMV